MSLLDRLKRLLDAPEGADIGDSAGLGVASAVLLFEVVWADHQIESAELQQLRASLGAVLGLDDDALDEVIDDARQRHEQGVGVFEYTRLVNEHGSAAQKFELVAHLWRVAFADGSASAIEEHTIRRLSDLLYVPHRDFIRAKQLARDGDQPAA